VKTVFVRDHAGAWYHRGVRGVGPDIASVAEHLRTLTAGQGEIVMVGNSAGGYGALLFGALLGCEVHAFAPQTFIDPALRKAHDDRRWENSVRALGDHMDTGYSDLRGVVAASNGRFHVYYPSSDRIDAIHAERLRGLPQVTLHATHYGAHGLVRALRSSGWLERFVNALAAGSAPPAPPRRIRVPPLTGGPGMVRDLAPGSKHLTVTFGGLGGGLGVWQAQIGRSEAARRHSSVHLRDHARAWYHRGVAGEGHDVDSVAGRLRDLAAGMERVVILGSSAGGYAALLFGALTGAEVHAFFPQTFIDPELRAAHGDTRWARRIDELGDDLDHRYVDLRPVLAGGEGRFHLYYATQDPLQALHAERLGELDHVTLHRIDDDWDDLVASGRLASFLGALPDAGGGSQPPALR
jgi:acetyl esterase/lipase